MEKRRHRRHKRRLMVKFGEKDFTQSGFFYKMGIEPHRVDILMGLEPLDFACCWLRREQVLLGKTPVFFISCPDLIENKVAAGRPQDLVDVTKLRKVLAR